MTPSEFIANEFASTWQWRIETDPEFAASLGMLARRQATHSLDPRCLESFHQRQQWVEGALDRIKSGITPEQIKNDLSKDERLSLDLYVKQLSDYLFYSKKHKAYLACVNRLEGPQTDLPLYARYLPVKTLQNREFYRDFLKAIPKQLGEVQAILTEENPSSDQFGWRG